jgi:hypothetical protein
MGLQNLRKREKGPKFYPKLKILSVTPVHRYLPDTRASQEGQYENCSLIMGLSVSTG